MGSAAVDRDVSNQVCEQVRQAVSAGTSLRVRGGASKPWMPVDSQVETLSVAKHRGIVSYDPTELVVTVRAGTPLAELDQLLATEGQMLGGPEPAAETGPTFPNASFNLSASKLLNMSLLLLVAYPETQLIFT